MTKEKNFLSDYKKLKIAIRYRLLGMNYLKALEAMEYAESLHTGERKDGQPEFSHQVYQVALALTLINHFVYPEETICVIFLHDVCEDKRIEFDQIEKKFGHIVRVGVQKMSKKYFEDGVLKKIDDDIYYDTLSKSEIGSVAKAIDRWHNVSSMLGGFTEDKQKDYMQHTLDSVLPMMKISRKKFPKQSDVYENIKFNIMGQIQLYKALHDKK